MRFAAGHVEGQRVAALQAQRRRIDDDVEAGRVGLGQNGHRHGELGLQPRGGTPAEFSAFIESEVRKWTEVIKSGNIKAD
ncbi:MAG: hypothetical protein NVS3B2_12620 [Ramlibacter sp.]